MARARRSRFALLLVTCVATLAACCGVGFLIVAGCTAEEQQAWQQSHPTTQIVANAAGAAVGASLNPTVQGTTNAVADFLHWLFTTPALPTGPTAGGAVITAYLAQRSTRKKLTRPYDAARDGERRKSNGTLASLMQPPEPPTR